MKRPIGSSIEYPKIGDRLLVTPMIVKLVIVITTILSLLILENKFPFFKFQNSLWSRIASNLELGVFNSIASSVLTIAISQSAFIWQQQPIIDAILLQRGEANADPVIAGILSFLVLDLYMYSWHRLMHILPLAWRFHRVHHTDRSMNVSTAYRFHAIEIISSSIPKLGLISWLGISGNLVLIYELVFTVIVALHHSNWAISTPISKILAQIVVTPDYHRIHHSQIVTETNSNYGSVFTWWDRIFQTNNSRLDIINIQLGVSDESRELSVWQLIRLPIGDN
jgi:sterol desaturase/sphingolipid hydroxylase (fatty acid hydroxylase superfamily)